MKITTDEKLARALLHEMDVTFQRFYHQSLRDVVQDLAVHNVLRTPEPSPQTLLRAIRRTGILEMHSAPPLARMRDVLDRYTRGTLGTCTGCGRSIARKDLLHNPSGLLCSRCRKVGQNQPMVGSTI
ncbi:MAG TPA: hypothetical protein VJB38_11620 [Bacteroidota bacterium]|nr:hypothetical protein [Bacteroidota bacterium]